MTPTAEQKQTLRRTLRALLKDPGLPRFSFTGRELDPWLENRLREKPGFLLGFSPLEGEADPLPLLLRGQEAGLEVFLPRVDLQDGEPRMDFYPWTPGTPLEDRDFYGIPCPRVQGPGLVSVLGLGYSRGLVLVPGLGFDRQGGRLGRGKGFYDRFLSLVPPAWVKLGTAFSWQVVPRVPMEALDRPLDGLVVPGEGPLPLDHPVVGF